MWEGPQGTACWDHGPCELTTMAIDEHQTQWFWRLTPGRKRKASSQKASSTVACASSVGALLILASDAFEKRMPGPGPRSVYHQQNSLACFKWKGFLIRFITRSSLCRAMSIYVRSQACLQGLRAWNAGPQKQER